MAGKSEGSETRLYGVSRKRMTDEQIDGLEENRKRAERLSKGFSELKVRANEPVVLSNDFHGSYYDRYLTEFMINKAEENGANKLFVIGDFWDCEGYKNEEKYLTMTWYEAFVDEKAHVTKLLERLLEHFKAIYFCRGNHEIRWMKRNRGMVGVDELFALTKVKGNYKVTLDDWMLLEHRGVKWLLVHPEKYSPTPLKISRLISDKTQCNVVSGHGHQLARGWNRTGEYRVVDNGGLFDSDQIDYLRRTTTFDSVMSGFNILMDGSLHEYSGKGVRKLVL